MPKLRPVLSALLGFLAIGASVAGSPQEAPSAGRAIMILDASGSMWGQIDGVNKIVIAREVVGDLMTEWSSDLHLGLMAYGHRREGDCGDIELLFAPGPDTAVRVPGVVDQINPKGRTPLTASVRAAAEELEYTEQSATVILVTDGRETCDLDPCAVAGELEAAGIDFTAHVVGFDIAPADRPGLACIADRTGGKYFDAKDAEGLSAALGDVVSETRASLQPDQLVAVMAEGLEPSDNGLINWRVFERDADGEPTDQRVYVGTTAAPRIALPPGAYFAVARLGAVEVSGPFDIVEGEPQRHLFVLNAAQIDAAYVLAEGGAASPEDVRWDVLPLIEGGRVGEAIASTVDENPVFYVPAGPLRLGVTQDHLSASEDVTAEAGGQYDVVVNMRVGEIVFDLDLDERGRDHDREVQWSLYKPDPEGGNPERIYFAVGRSAHKIRAPAGPHKVRISVSSTYERWFDVVFVEGETQTRTIVLDAGILRMQTSGREVAYGFSSFFRKNEAGEWEQAGDMSSSNLDFYPYVFATGEYQLRARGPGGAVEAEFMVTAGETTELSIDFP